MRIYFLMALFIITLCTLSAQDIVTTQNATNKILKQFDRASSEKNVDKKIKKLEKLVQKHPNFVDAYTELGLAFYQKKDYERATKNVLVALEIAPNYKVKNYVLAADLYNTVDDIDKELELLDKYLLKETNRNKFYENVLNRVKKLKSIKTLSKIKYAITLEKFPKAINSTEFAEYKPVLTLDSKEIIFTRRVNGQEDFYKSTYRDNEWTKAVPVETLNTPNNEGAHAISPDGNWLIFTKCNAPNRYRSCDLYITKRSNKGWSTPQYMNLLNTEAWESQASFSADGNRIYFSSNRSGGYGGKDIYYVDRINGKWSTPKNAGSSINTSGNEASPFIHPDGRTMYFMSDTHTGFGKYDLFMSKLSEGKWSTPKNLGPEINTKEDEGGLYVDVSGDYAYFSRTKKLSNNKLDSDIYKFKLPKEFQPDRLTYTHFVVYDNETQQPISANLEITELEDQSIIEKQIPNSGLFIALSPDKTYQILIDQKDYIFHSEVIKPEYKKRQYDPILYKIYLQKIKALPNTETKAVVLKNVVFESGSDQLLPQSLSELNKLIRLLKSNIEKRILLNSHTDNVGTEASNLLLSKKRLESVKNYLLDNGISTHRIDLQAYGETMPIMDNNTPEGRAYNRRIEFILK